MIVNTAIHILDVNRDNPILPLGEVLGNRPRLQAVDVPDIHAQSEPTAGVRLIRGRCPGRTWASEFHTIQKFTEVVKSFDQHSRFGFESQGNMALGGILHEFDHTRNQSIQCFIA